MRMLKHILLLVVLLTGLTLRAQDDAIIISGIILDQETREVLPLATVRLKGTSTGAISNFDGRFDLKLTTWKAADTLIFTYVGYARVKRSIAQVQQDSAIYLAPLFNDLNEVEVVVKGNRDFAYELLGDIATNYRRMNDIRQSRTYFSLQSKTGRQPLELIEGFYNSTLTPTDGISRMELKNGRIGLSQRDGQYFVSLSTTDLISDYPLFRKTKYRTFPASPFNVSASKIKDMFEARVVAMFEEEGDKIYRIEFKPRVQTEELFEGEVTINYSEMAVRQIDYQIRNCKQRIVEPVDKEEVIDTININLKAEFQSGENRHLLKLVDLHYDLGYTNDFGERFVVEGRALVHAYELDQQFILPVYTSDAEHRTDYHKILTIPFNEDFWQWHHGVPRTEEQKEFMTFFKNHGILVNHENKGLDNKLGSKFRWWDENYRIGLHNLNADYSLEGRYLDYVEPSELYEIEIDILVDVSQIGDKVLINSVTLLDTENSYYLMRPDANTRTYLNMYFDLYEIKRRELEKRLEGMDGVSAEEVRLTFLDEFRLIYDDMQDFDMEVQRGAAKESFRRWNRYIYDHLGIDNFKLRPKPN